MSEEEKGGIHALEIETNDSVIRVSGGYGVLNTAVSEWRDAVRGDIDPDAALVEVVGFNYETRKDIRIVVRATHIVGMSLQEVVN